MMSSKHVSNRRSKLWNRHCFLWLCEGSSNWWNFRIGHLNNIVLLYLCNLSLFSELWTSDLSNEQPIICSFFKWAINYLLIFQMSKLFFAHLSNEQIVLCSFFKWANYSLLMWPCKPSHPPSLFHLGWNLGYEL